MIGMSLHRERRAAVMLDGKGSWSAGAKERREKVFGGADDAKGDGRGEAEIDDVLEGAEREDGAELGAGGEADAVELELGCLRRWAERR